MSFRNMWKADKKCEVMDLDYCEKNTLEESKVSKPVWKIMNNEYDTHGILTS